MLPKIPLAEALPQSIGNKPLLGPPSESIQIGLATPIPTGIDSENEDISIIYLLGQKPAVPRALTDLEKNKLPKTKPIEGEYNIKIGG